MVRPRRSQDPRRIWHAMSRGVRQSPIFLSTEDREAFLGIADRAARRSGLDVLAYCLMDNHYHLLVAGTGSCLGRTLQELNSAYAREFNQRTGTVGHLFQGRFRSYPARSGPWMVRRSVYIHLNPVEAGIVVDPILYPWSSLKSIVGGRTTLAVDPTPVLNAFGETRRDQVRSYLDHLRREQEKCSALRIYAQRILEKPMLRPRSVEEVRIQVGEVQALLEAAAREVRTTAGTERERTLRILQLVSYLTGRWNRIPAEIVAVVIGYSASQIRSLRHRMKENPPRDELVSALIDHAKDHGQDYEMPDKWIRPSGEERTSGTKHPLSNV